MNFAKKLLQRFRQREPRDVKRKKRDVGDGPDRPKTNGPDRPKTIISSYSGPPFCHSGFMPESRASPIRGGQGGVAGGDIPISTEARCLLQDTLRSRPLRRYAPPPLLGEALGAASSTSRFRIVPGGILPPQRYKDILC
jgi:hypothetical protein